MFGFGLMEAVLVGAAVVLFFGARKIPTIARGLGEGIRNFKGEIKEPDDPGDGPPRLEDKERGDD